MKSFAPLSLTVASILAGQFSVLTIRAELVSYWPLDEVSGETAADVVSGNDAAWQNSGNNLSWISGRIGGAAKLVDGGGAGANNYFEMMVPELIGADAMTIAAWIDPEPQGSSGYNGIVMTRNFNGNTSWGMAIENNGDERFDSRVDGPGIDSPNGLLSPNADWIHIAMVWDGTAGTHTQYVNGVETASVAGVFNGTISGPESQWFIGYDNCCGNTRDFDGAIDEVAFWNEALPADKIALLADGIRARDLDAEDLDEDGLPNDYEDMFAFLDPNDPGDAALDEDSDGLSNLEEFRNDTDPENPDTDGDGLVDGAEISDHGSNPKAADTDGDGIEDGEEVVEGADGFVTSPILADTDGDGFDDLEEIGNGTDPTDASSPPPPEPGLIGYWPLDETSGETAADLVNGNDGIWQNPGPINLEWVPGIIGGAAKLSDLGGNSYFQIESINQLLRSRACTISAWIDPDENPGYNGIFMTRMLNGESTSWGLAFQNDAGGPNHLDTRVDEQATDSAPDSLSPDEGWFHIAMVWDGVAGTHKQYINGVETGAADGSLIGLLMDTSGPWFIGYDDCCGGGRDFNGTIDDVGFWNAALSAEEVATIYENGLKGIGLIGTDRDLPFRVDTSGDDLVLTWSSQDGKLYNVRSETDPAVGDPLDWPVFGGQQDLEATAPENTLVIPRPADPFRLFVIEEFNAPPVSIFFDDFESGAGEWTTGSDGTDGTEWELGAPSGVGPSAANSPDNCFGTNLATDYTVNANVWLRSPEIDLTTAGAATLSFFQAFDIEAGFDFGQVAVLDVANDSELAVVEGSIDGLSADWERVTRTIPAVALGKVIKIEFRFTSDELENFAGWYLDDVEVTVP